LKKKENRRTRKQEKRTGGVTGQTQGDRRVYTEGGGQKIPGILVRQEETPRVESSGGKRGAGT